MSTQQRIVAMACRRVCPADIARHLDVKVDKVYSAIRWARSSGTEIPHFGTGRRHLPAVSATPGRQITVPLPLHNLLTSAAEKRGETPSETARRLLEASLLGTGEFHEN